MSEKVKVVVTVMGGVVSSVMAGVELDVVVVDWDNIKAGDLAPHHLAFKDGTNVDAFMKAPTTGYFY